MSKPADMLQLFGTADDSIVDGPGIRFAVFTQGCAHACPGCHNPEAQPFCGGQAVSVDELWQQVQANPLLTGITLTGGEPFDQPEPLLLLAQRARAAGLTVWAYSGYTYEELMSGVPSAAARALLAACDVLVDGRFVAAQASYELKWRGSANQRLINVPASLASALRQGGGSAPVGGTKCDTESGTDNNACATPHNSAQGNACVICGNGAQSTAPVLLAL